MKMKDIVLASCELLRLDDVYEEIVHDLEINDDGLLLIKCADLAVKQVVTEYVPLEFKEDITVIDNKYPYQALLKTPVVITKILDKTGARVQFKTMSSYVMTQKSGDLTIFYTYEPKSKQLNEEIDYDGLVPSYVFAYATAFEYCAVMSLFEEAAVWESKFKSSLRNILSSRGERRIKARAFE